VLLLYNSQNLDFNSKRYSAINGFTHLLPCKCAPVSNWQNTSYNSVSYAALLGRLKPPCATRLCRAFQMPNAPVFGFLKSRIGMRGCSKFLLVTLSAYDCICNQCVYFSFLLLIQSQKACHRLAAVAKTSYTRRRYTKYFAD
jgi:hypothetical protein